MTKYLITADIEEEIEAEDEDEAINQFFEIVERTPQQTLGTYLFEHLKATKIE